MIRTVSIGFILNLKFIEILQVFPHNIRLRLFGNKINKVKRNAYLWEKLHLTPSISILFTCNQNIGDYKLLAVRKISLPMSCDRIFHIDLKDTWLLLLFYLQYMKHGQVDGCHTYSKICGLFRSTWDYPQCMFK